MISLSKIHSLISQARRRLKIQAALEWATRAFIGAAFLWISVTVLMGLGLVDTGTAVYMLAVVAVMIVGGVVWGALRPFSRNYVATLVDRQAGLADRLATACSFEARLAAGTERIDEDTEEMMRLAMGDAVSVVERANVAAATPFTLPKQSKLAAMCAVLAALTTAVGLGDKHVDGPALHRVTPSAAAVGTQAVLLGNGLLAPSGPVDTQVFFGDREFLIQSVTGNSIEFRVPLDASPGMVQLAVRVGGQRSAGIPFEILASDDPRVPDSPDNVELDEEDMEYAADLVAELKQTAKSNEDLALEQLAKELDALVSDAKEGKLSKKELLDALAKAEEKYLQGSEKSLQESLKDLKEAGKELKKDKLTKELGKALEQAQLSKAQSEMEKLAQKIDDNKLTDKQQIKIGKAMEKAADKMKKLQDQREQQMDKQIAKQKESVRKLEKDRQEEKDPKRQEDKVRRLQKEKRELKRLQKKKEEKEKDSNKRELKKLQRKMKQTAKQMQQKKQQKQQRSRREVSKSMRDMARSAGKVSQDKRKMANRAKVVTQMSDLKEAMRRAKRKGKKGPKNSFGKNRRKGSRSRGQGQGPGQGPGQGKPGPGQGKPGPGQKGPGYGDEHDPNVLGKKTKKSGGTVDESLQGVRGRGPSTRETILTAAQKGFASRSYQDVYTQYKDAIEEVIKSEKVPSGYRYYVKRYFQKIKPNAEVQRPNPDSQ